MSDFFGRKVKTYFGQHDLDNDGFVSLNDFVQLAERQSDATKSDAAQREKLKGCFIKVWRQWMKSAGSDDSGLLTASIMKESLKQQRNDPEFKEAYLEICRNFFKLLDVNGDGFLKEDDYVKSLANIGFKDTSITRRAFESMDPKGTGKIGVNEFSAACFEYIASEDETSPNAMLWGTLVE